MENLIVCTNCGGECCKFMGCHYSPDDFENISFDSLKKQIDKGHISIDWWEGNPFDEEDDFSIQRAFFLRIRNINKYDKDLSPIVDPSFGGICSLLTETGCSISYDNRPKGGRELIPRKRDKDICISNYDKKQCAIEWYKYNEILYDLYKNYNEPMAREETIEKLFSFYKNQFKE